MIQDLLNNEDAARKVHPLDVETIIGRPDKNQLSKLRLLENVQGNILKDHGRDHSIHLVLKGFKTGDPAKIRQGIQSLASATYPLQNNSFSQQTFHYLASAKEQHMVSRLATGPQKAEYQDTYFVNFYLSRSGYEALSIEKLPDELIYRTTNDEQKVTKTGLRNALKQIVEENTSHISDTGIPLDDWEELLDKIDGMILIAHSKKDRLVDNKKMLKLEEPLQSLVDTFKDYIVDVEVGEVMYNASNELIEHFGYRDGISNPLFYKNDIEKEQARHATGGQDPYGTYSQAAPLNLALVSDPNCQPEDYAYGSYCVFAKLEQDVQAFYDAIQNLAACLEGNNQEEKVNRAKALVMGRFPDGTPIVLKDTDGGINGVSAYNNYDQKDPDPYGYRCPMHAHIRRINPRGQEPYTQIRRIVRRGITYGDPKKQPKDNPSRDELPREGVGLLFISFQASLSTQFEFIVSQWALYSAQRDAVVAEKKPGKTLGFNQWPTKWEKDPITNEPVKKFCAFGRHVRVLGGEYFFAPSVKFLQNIATK